MNRESCDVPHSPPFSITETHLKSQHKFRENANPMPINSLKENENQSMLINSERA